MPPFACKRCGGTEDDVHVFITCPYAATVWDLAPIRWRLDSSTSSLVELLTQAERMFSLLRERMEVVQKAIKDAKEWQEAQLSQAKPLAIPHPPLRHNSADYRCEVSGPTCHVDAAWSPVSDSCGIGGIFSGPIHPSLPIIRYNRRFISTTLMAECLAIRYAVMTAASSNIRSLTVFSDSQVIIKLLKTKESRPLLFGILDDIYHFSKVSDRFTRRRHEALVEDLKSRKLDLTGTSILNADSSLLGSHGKPHRLSNERRGPSPSSEPRLHEGSSWLRETSISTRVDRRGEEQREKK
ncbi:uncharacterized protein LOC125578183 [Brassica napus]|uniref:uncharacterized protein LOC125578183 n=1 Tax=Brassica napus TaxID=3708 RepID=UPI002078F708|nr:uncharacterized protein LOC125578183 [Brassica napus]